MSEHQDSSATWRDEFSDRRLYCGVRLRYRLTQAVSRRRHGMTVRARCRSHLRGIAIPEPFTLEAFCAQIAEIRRRPLHLKALPQPTDPALPTGLWLNGETADYVFYDGQTSELHQQQIVLHEIGHMLFGHDHELLDDNDVLFRGPHDPLRTSIVRRIHTRRRYSTLQEREAEEFATLLLEEKGSFPPPSRRNGFTTRMAAALSDNYGVH